MKNVKRALSLVLVLALALSMCVLGAGAVKYSDVENSYAYSAEVQFLSDLEIITGYPDGTFQPEGTITRAESAAVIFRMLAGKQSAAENYQGGTVFSDVSAEHWASGYVNFCTEMGIINGYPDGTFLPDQDVTYGEYVTMLARALGLDIGKDLSYPFGYIAEATVENVNYGVDLSASEPCPRGAVAKLTYNAILDATYRRIANNIYVTEKPTIAKDVLKLQLMEGVVTSIDNYDWAGDNAVGEGKFRITWAKDTENIDNRDGTANSTWAADYELDNSYLGKAVKVWYKPDSVTASGDKVYAVIEKASSTASLPHIVLKGAIDGEYNELTYALDDVDYTAKLDNDCVFVENNEYIGDIGGAEGADAYFGAYMDATEFYAPGIRAWLPINYNFIDNDNDGKYEFVVREVYGFGEVANLTSSKVQIDGQTAVDRNDDAGNAYDWNDALNDVEIEDWVLYYADGAITVPGEASVLLDLAEGPDFASDLFEDTHYATFEKLEMQTLELENIVDDDKFTFDGTTYRTWTYGGADFLDTNPDLTVDVAEIGDEYDIYATTKFGGIIAKSELVTPSSGKYLVVREIERDGDENLGGNFDILAVNEKGDEEVYTVKAKDDRNLEIYEDNDKADEIGLTYEAVKALKQSNALCEYTTNSEGQITSLNAYAGAIDLDPTEGNGDEFSSTYAGQQVDADGDNYKKTTGLLRTTDGTSYYITDTTLVYVIMPNGADTTTKVYTGAFPKVELGGGEYATVDITGMQTKTSSGVTEVKAMAVYTDAAVSGTSGVSASENVTGYLRSITRFGDAETGYGYEYTIAYDGDVAATFRTATVDEAGDLSDLSEDDIIFPEDFRDNKADVIVFDIQTDGTVANMRYMNDAYTAEMNGDLALIGSPDSNDYYGTFMVSNVNNSRKMVTLVPMLNEEGDGLDANLIPGAKKAADVVDEDVLAIANRNIGNEITYKVADDAVVYVIDMASTNEAKVEIGSLGSLIRPTLDRETDEILEGYLVSFAYDADDEVITAIFFNDLIVD